MAKSGRAPRATRSTAKPTRTAESSAARATTKSPPYNRALVAPALAKVRALCHALPDVIERPSHGAPAFLTGKRAFAYFHDNHHGDGRLAVWCAAPDGAQAMLIDTSPERYFLPPYVAHLGWIGVRLDRKPSWREIAAVLEAAHQTRHRPPRPRKASAKLTARRRR